MSGLCSKPSQHFSHSRPTAARRPRNHTVGASPLHRSTVHPRCPRFSRRTWTAFAAIAENDVPKINPSVLDAVDAYTAKAVTYVQNLVKQTTNVGDGAGRGGRQTEPLEGLHHNSSGRKGIKHKHKKKNAAQATTFSLSPHPPLPPSGPNRHSRDRWRRTSPTRTSSAHCYCTTEGCCSMIQCSYRRLSTWR